jgi:hypothetical protein
VLGWEDTTHCGAHLICRQGSRTPDASSVAHAIFTRFEPPPEVSLSPILLRPVREQLEHDRVIRLLQAKYKRKFEVLTNLGNEQKAPVPIGQSTWFPDLVLQATDKGKKILGIVEVETAESVNKVEAMSQWVAFSRARAQFHLYVPVSMIDVARQLAGDLQVTVGEIWAFHVLGDQIRFTLIQRSSRALEEKARPAVAAVRPPAAPRRAAASRARAARPAAARTTRRAAAAPLRKAAKTASRAAAKKTSRTSRAQKRK